MFKKNYMIYILLFIPIILLSNTIINYDETLFLFKNHKTNKDISLWLNKEKGSTYKIGENIEIFFETPCSSSLIIFDINSDGKVQIIYPDKYNGFPVSEKSRTCKIPASEDTLFYDLTVGDSTGKEYILALLLNEYPEFIKSQIIESEFLPVIELSIEEIFEKLSPFLEEGFSYNTVYFYNDIIDTRGTLEISSFPENCKIYLNNEFLGNTPVFTGLDTGYYMLETKYASDSILEKIFIQPGRKTSIYHQFNVFEKGKIYFNKTDKSDEIRLFVNDEFFGYLPVKIEEFPGDYNFTFINSKNEKNHTVLSIEENKIKYININKNLGVE